MGNYTQLSKTERRRFYVFLEMGLSVSEIAKRLSRLRSTLYRERARSKEPEGYLPGMAQLNARNELDKSDPLHYKLQRDDVVKGLKNM